MFQAEVKGVNCLPTVTELQDEMALPGHPFSFVPLARGQHGRYYLYCLNAQYLSTHLDLQLIMIDITVRQKC